jgi:hypothetical protein
VCSAVLFKGNFPVAATGAGRRRILALRWSSVPHYFGMMVTIAPAFGWAFYLPTGSALPTFMAVLFFLGVFGATLRFSAYGCRSCSAPKRSQPPPPSARRCCGRYGHAWERPHLDCFRHWPVDRPLRARDPRRNLARVTRRRQQVHHQLHSGTDHYVRQ